MSMPNWKEMKWEERMWDGKSAHRRSALAGPNSVYVQLDSLAETASAVPNSELYTYRDLRGFDVTLRLHPKYIDDRIEERVRHLGYLEGPQDNKQSLLYQTKFPNIDNMTYEQQFMRGEEFATITFLPDGSVFGEPHGMKNISDRTIVLQFTTHRAGEESAS